MFKHRHPRWLKFLTALVWLAVFLTVGALANLWYLLPTLAQAYQDSLQAKVKLEQSFADYQNRQFDQAQTNLRQAETLFNRTLSQVKIIKATPIAWTAYFRRQINDLESLLTVAASVSATGDRLVGATKNILQILPNYALPNYTKLTAAQKKSFWQAVVTAEPELNKAKLELVAIKADLVIINNPSFLKDSSFDLTVINERLDELNATVAEADFYARILPSVMGYPRTSRWLIVLQNKNELRPTGGFIGTYGLMTVDNGEITRLTTDDSYHLDMPVKDKFKVEPPPAMKKYLKINNWYFRDSNWSPDWPSSARKVAWFYQEENKRLAGPDPLNQFDFVVAVTPDLVMDLMDITGPITIDYRTYTKANFMELLQATTEKNYGALGLSSWNRKQEIGRLTKAIYDKLIAKLDSNRSEILDVLKNNLSLKNVLIYAADYEIADFLRQNNWDGQMDQTVGDYVMVVDANLGALKTDAVINRNLDYRLEETGQGLVAHLTVNYANTGHYSWQTGKYQTYTRVFVPRGSKLIKAAGFFGNAKDLTIGEELGKTYFGGWLEVDPGKIGNLSFDYLLPDKVWQTVRAKNYQLTIQKQPGSDIQDLRVNLSFNNRIKAYQPQSLHVSVADDKIGWKDELDTDRNFTVSFY